MKKQRILFAINQKSGAAENTGIESDISEMMTDNPDYQSDTFLLSGDDILQSLKERINSYNPDIVVAAGGDGTINMVASILAGTRIKLGIIPLGSANGLAAELGIPNGLKDAINLILKGKTKPMDIVRINDDHISLHLSDVGINARIIKEFEKEGKRGLKAYLKHFIKELWKPQPSFLCTILTGGKMHTHRAYMTIIANCNKYKTGAVINPSGKWDDGLFEVVVIKPHKNWILKCFIGAFTRTFHLQPHIEVYNCASAVVSVMPAQELQVDGETLGKHSEVRSIIEPHALQVISEA